MTIRISICILCDPFEGEYPDHHNSWCGKHAHVWLKSPECIAYFRDDVPIKDRDLYLGRFLVRTWTQNFWGGK